MGKHMDSSTIRYPIMSGDLGKAALILDRRESDKLLDLEAHCLSASRLVYS